MNGPIALGKVVRAHGVRGAVRVFPYDDESENLPRLKTAVLRRPDGSTRALRIASCSRAGRNYLVSLAGIDTRDEAEKLVGAELLLDRAEFAPLPDGRHYLVDLIGLEVRTESGAVLGRLADLMKTGANDVLVIEREGGKEVLLPDIPGVVLDIDAGAGRITVRVPPGLLGDDAL